MAKNEIKYEVKSKLGVIEEKGNNSLELRIVSWNDGEALYDIRPWYTDKNGEEKCGKGVRLTEDGLQKLAEIINGIEVEI